MRLMLQNSLAKGNQDNLILSFQEQTNEQIDQYNEYNLLKHTYFNAHTHSHCSNIADGKSRLPFIRPQAVQKTKKKHSKKYSMFPTLPPPSFFSPLLCLKSSFSTFQLHLSNFTLSIFKLGRDGRNWVISLCLVKELTHKKPAASEKAILICEEPAIVTLTAIL